MDRFRGMETFVAVVDHKGIAAAARALGQSKAQVSRSLSAFEDHLGVRLLQRSTRQQSLTEEGERFLVYAREALEQYQQIEAELGQRRENPRGRLRVNAPLSFGERYIGPLLPRFLERYPDLELEVTLTDRFVDLVEEGYDVAIRIGGDPTSNLIGKKLGTIESGLLASPAYLETAPAIDRAQDLRKHACLCYAVTGEVKPWHFRGERVTVKPTMVSNNGDILMEAAIAGRGLTVLPFFIADKAIADGRLINLTAACPPDAPDLQTTLMAVYPERRHLSSKVRVFLDFLEETLS